MLSILITFMEPGRRNMMFREEASLLSSNRISSPFLFQEQFGTNMTGRQDNAPVVSARAENLQKDMQNFQIRDVQRSSELPLLKRAANKPMRPPMEIYTPRNIFKKIAMKTNDSAVPPTFSDKSNQLIGSKEALTKNGSKVHFVEGAPMERKSSPSLPVELKSALKRSKSFTTEETDSIRALGFEKDAFPLEYQGLIRRAISDPNLLSCQKLMELVRLICSKAVENVQYSSPASHLCFAIIEKEHDHMFLESLQNCCREWYNERDKLLRTPFVTSGGGLRRWTAFVLFLTEMYTLVKKQHQQMAAPHPNSPMAHLALTLQTLLYDCAGVILKPPSLHCETEIEILRTVLKCVGQQLELDSAQRMEHLMMCVREAFIHPSVSAHIRKSLLEMVEFQASQWDFDMSQTRYYFPYTKF